MDQLPVSRVRAAATVLGSRVFYCGGYDHQYQKSCYSVELDAEHPVWQEEASMTTERRDFGLTAVVDKLFATGGFYGSALAHSSVEVFTYGEGWRQWLKLEMTISLKLTTQAQQAAPPNGREGRACCKKGPRISC